MQRGRRRQAAARRLWVHQRTQAQRAQIAACRVLVIAYDELLTIHGGGGQMLAMSLRAGCGGGMLRIRGLPSAADTGRTVVATTSSADGGRDRGTPGGLSAGCCGPCSYHSASTKQPMAHVPPHEESLATHRCQAQPSLV